MARPKNCKVCKRPKETQCKCGRPTKMTPETIQKLVYAFQRDYTDGEACRYAGIGTTTFYNHCKSNKEFREKIELAKDFIFNLAKDNLITELQDKNKFTTKWVLERRQKDRYSEKVEQDHTTQGQPIYLGLPPSQFKKDEEE